MDLKLNEFHDLYVDAAGGVALEADYRGSARQRLLIRLQLFLGEWFLNTRLGFPYYRDVLVKNPNFSVIRGLLRAWVLRDPEVVAVPRLEMSLDRGARRLSVDFEATLRDGSTVAVTYPPAVAGTPWDPPQLPGATTPAQPLADPVIEPWTVDLRLANGDLYVGPAGEVELWEALSDAVRQRLVIRLQLFLGEWFLNTRLGFPYYRDVLVKNPNFSVIRGLLRDTVLSDPDVVAVPRLELALENRRLSADFEAIIRDGSIVSVEISSGMDNYVVASGDFVLASGDFVVAS